MSFFSIAQRYHARKCAVIGCSGVGSAVAHAISQCSFIDQLVLIDPNQRASDGLAADLSCALPIGVSMDLWSGEYSDLGDCSLIVLALGHGYLHESAHADLIELNLPIIRTAIANITAHAQDACIVVLSRPCEIMTYAVLRYAGLPQYKVMGVGTLAQTLYLRKMLGKYLGVDARQLEAMIIGQSDTHGILSPGSMRVCGTRIEDYLGANGRSYDAAMLQSFYDDTLHAFERAEDASGCAQYAIAQACTLILNCILADTNTILPICTAADTLGDVAQCCLSLPCTVGRHGAHPLPDIFLTSTEHEQLRRSAARLHAQMLNAEQILS